MKIISNTLGMSGKDFLKRFPSYIRGSVLQTVQSCKAPREYRHVPGQPNVMLVPGLFCSPSVFNHLGKELEQSCNVFLPGRFPYWFGMLCNTASIEMSAKLLRAELYHLYVEGVEEISLVGHSLGGLIVLAALRNIHPAYSPRIKEVICLGTPFNGAPATNLLGFIPACKDMQPKSKVLPLDQSKLTLSIVSGKDSVVPPMYQIPNGWTDMKVFDDFQHMDFYVGSKEKVKKTAELIADRVSRSCR